MTKDRLRCINNLLVFYLKFNQLENGELVMESEKEMVMLTQVTNNGNVFVSVDELKVLGNIQSVLPSNNKSGSYKIRLGNEDVVELMPPKNDLEMEEFIRLVTMD